MELTSLRLQRRSIGLPSKAIFANGKYYIYPTINGYMYPAVADKPEGPFKTGTWERRIL